MNDYKINVIVLFIISGIIGCLGGEKISTDSDQVEVVSGYVKVDGSSTVYPITEAIAEEFQILHKKVRVTVGISGTGGGFKKFCNGETDINDASRPIKQKEIDLCKKNGIEAIEIPIAFDGLSIVVNPENDWVTEGITARELKSIWNPDSTVIKWSDIRPEWPDKEMFLVGPDPDSGTFDYFTNAINGEEHSSRSDYTASADDNVLVQAISGEKYSLGYFGYAYYSENKGKLKLVAINDENDENGKGFIKPDPISIGKGTYQPLSRPIFIYVNKNSADRPEIAKFINFSLTEGGGLASEVGYIPLPDNVYNLGLKRFEDRNVDSLFTDNSKVGVNIETLMTAN
tara:strand:+ start:507 stop:1535 length:1029 start_codon:yes stop_codon:yes gene_type:complete